jgi:uncharacterized protein
MDPIASQPFSNFKVDVASLPQYETVGLHSLSKKYMIKLQAMAALSFLFFSTMIFVASLFLPGKFQNYLVAAGIFLLVVLLWSIFNNYMYVKRSGYALREQDIIFKRGFLFERTTVVPFNRIQHVSTERSFLDKTLKISTLQIFTAGGSGSDISIPGVYPEAATAMKEEISSRIHRHV